MAETSELPEAVVEVRDEQSAQVEENPNDDFGTSAEANVVPSGNNIAEPSAMSLDGAADATEIGAPEHDQPLLETRIPAKKDASLREFLSKMDDYAPIVRPTVCATTTRHLIDM